MLNADRHLLYKLIGPVDCAARKTEMLVSGRTTGAPSTLWVFYQVPAVPTCLYLLHVDLKPVLNDLDRDHCPDCRLIELLRDHLVAVVRLRFAHVGFGS